MRTHSRIPQARWPALECVENQPNASGRGKFQKVHGGLCASVLLPNDNRTSAAAAAAAAAGGRSVARPKHTHDDRGINFLMTDDTDRRVRKPPEGGAEADDLQ